MQRNRPYLWRVNRAIIFSLICVCAMGAMAHADRVYPEKEWRVKSPSALGMEQEKLDRIAELLQGRGLVIRHGYVAKTWGDQSKKGDWMSSSKPLFSTLLFFAIQEKMIGSVHKPIKDFGWDLNQKDRTMTFHHLANMTSGYARPDKPGAAWAYNDYAINLYRLTLFEELFKQPPDIVCGDPNRFGSLQFQDGLSFNKKVRVIASARDFARLGWFWLNRGNWDGRQLLAPHFFDDYVKPHVPKNLPPHRQSEYKRLFTNRLVWRRVGSFYKIRSRHLWL